MAANETTAFIQLFNCLFGQQNMHNALQRIGLCSVFHFRVLGLSLASKDVVGALGVQD